MSACNLKFEAALRAEGAEVIAGVDEAGRGPLAGPVYAAAVILPEDYAHPFLNDSKLLTKARREKVYAELIEDREVTVCSATAEVEEIERINILRATHLAMERAVHGLTRAPDVVLIDGLEVQGFPVRQKAIVKGDRLSLSIAAASVVAKVERDRVMLEYDREYPEYGFRSHKGYATKEHLANLRCHGPCPIHRKTFRPVAECALPLDEEHA